MRRCGLWLTGCLALCGCSSGGPAAVHNTGAPAASRQAPTQRADRPANGMILDAASGRPIASVTVHGPIIGAASDGHGGWYIGGGFTTVDGHARVGLARISANGSLDTGWRPRPLKPPRMREWVSLARAGDRVLVAGGFQVPPHGHLGGALALSATTGALLRSWQAPNECSDGDWEVRTAGGRGWIATACAGGACLFAVDPGSGRALTWDAHIAAMGEVGCLDDMAFARGEVYFTGGFSAVGGAPRHGLAAVSVTDGANDAAFDPPGGCAGEGHALSVDADRVYVGGDTCPVAALDATTGKPVWAWPRRGNHTTAALLATPTRVYVGGSFGTLAHVAANGFVALNPRTGAAEPSWHPPEGSEILMLARSGPRILVGG